MSHIGEYTANDVILEKALIPSTEEAKEYMNPVQDDTWVRHAEFVKIESLTETAPAAEIKKEILRDYQSSKKIEPDPVLEGMLFQEKFMNEYKESSSRQDTVKAMGYREQMMQEFRKANRPGITNA